MKRPKDRTEFWLYIETLHFWTAHTLDQAREIAAKLVQQGLDPNLVTIMEVNHRVCEGAARTVAVLLTAAIMWAMLGACALRHHHPVIPQHEVVCLVTPCGDTCCNDDGKVCPPCTKDLYPKTGGVR